MEIRRSKSIYVFFGWLSSIIVLALLIKFLIELQTSTAEITLGISLLTISAIIPIYLFYHANDKRPVYKLTESEIILCKKNIAYRFSDLKYFRYEKIRGKGSLEIFYFYDENKSRICDIKITFTDISAEQIIDFLKGRLIRLETPKGFY